MTEKFFFLMLIVFVTASESIACGPPGWRLVSKACEIRVSGWSDKMEWAESLQQKRKDCGFTVEEMDWLSKNLPHGGYVEEQTNSEYQKEVARIKEWKTEKTVFNFWKWKRIDRKNKCVDLPILARWGRWTVFGNGGGRWFEDMGVCAQPNC